MPDNITTPIGEIIAADEIGGVKYPRGKVGFGADGVYADVSPAARLPVDASPSVDQDPVFDHAAGTRVSVTTASTAVITVPAGCKFLRIDSEANAFVRTDGTAAADNGGSVRLIANVPEIIPVAPGAVVRAIVATGAAIVRATPLRVR